jgi:hypothetical protein
MSGLCLAVPALVSFSAGQPTPLCPTPVLTVFPAFIFGLGAMLVPVALFFAWNPGLFRGQDSMPKRTHWLLGILISLSLAWFVGGWQWGVQYEGIRFVRIVAIVNAFWAVLFVVLFAFFRNRKPSFKINLLLHWLLFAWLAWYAFPYLGELP